MMTSGGKTDDLEIQLCDIGHCDRVDRDEGCQVISGRNKLKSIYNLTISCGTDHRCNLQRCVK